MYNTIGQTLWMNNKNIKSENGLGLKLLRGKE